MEEDTIPARRRIVCSPRLHIQHDERAGAHQLGLSRTDAGRRANFQILIVTCAYASHGALAAITI